MPLVALWLVSCDFTMDLIPEKQDLENGIFVGVVYDSYPTAYEILSGEIFPLGHSAKLERITPIDASSFTASPENESFSSFICKRTEISTADYRPADNEQTKNFSGLWFSMRGSDSYTEGLVLAIKPMGDHWEITLNDFNGNYKKVKGEIKMVDGHQELSFPANTEITGRENETWTLMAPGLTGYDFRVNILSAKTDNDLYYKFIAIHNVE